MTREALRLGVLGVLLSAAMVCGCRMPGAKRSKSSKSAAAKKKGSKKPQLGRSLDPSYQGVVWAHHYRLHTKLAMQQTRSFARLSGKRAHRLEQLTRGAEQTVDVYAAGDRALLVLPDSAAGGSHELLIADDLGRIFVINPVHHRIWSRPRSEFADALDLARASKHSPVTADLLRLAGAPGRHGRRVRRHRVRLALSYRPPDERVRRWSLRVVLDTEGPDFQHGQPLHDLRFRHPLFHVALPLLQSRRGLLTLEGIAYQTARPWRFRSTIANETLGGPALSRSTVVEDRGNIRLSAARFASKREGYVESRRLRLPSTRQLVSKRDLRGLRKGAAAKLHVKNRSPFATVIYLDAIRVAWLAPGAELDIEGLSTGFYRVFATTPTGSRTWPVRDMYVPGPLTLD